MQYYVLIIVLSQGMRTGYRIFTSVTSILPVLQFEPAVGIEGFAQGTSLQAYPAVSFSRGQQCV